MAATTSDQGPEFIGLAEANAAVKRWAKTQLPDDFAKGSRSFAESMRTQIESKVPVLTGLLASTVVVVPEPDGNAVGMGNEETPYAGWIEFGGSRGRDLIPEGRYVYPTVMANQSTLESAAEQATTSSINRYPWPQA